MSKIFFSVIIPTFNRKELVKRAIKSVLNQSYKEFELIVIDDASTDGTYEELKNISGIKLLVNEKNRGVSYSRNRGIKEAKGNIIAFLDSDDEWKKDKLLIQKKAFENSNCKIHQTDEIWIKNGVFWNKKKKHQKKEGDIFYNSLRLCLISPSAVAIRKEVFDEVGLFDESLEVCEDYDLWLRITKIYPVCFSKEKMVIKYGGHSDQLSKKYFAMDRFRVYSMLKILKKEYDKKVEEVILEKLAILENGAKKRGNKKILEFVEKVRVQLDLIK